VDQRRNAWSRENGDDEGVVDVHVEGESEVDLEECEDVHCELACQWGGGCEGDVDAGEEDDDGIV